jgi:hypothetical protein
MDLAVKLLGTLKDFSAGLSVQDAANLIPENALTEAENAVIGRGFVSKRSGYEQHASSATVSYLTWAEFGAKKWSEV